MSDVDTLFDAILNRRSHVSLQTIRTVDNLLDAVYSKEPRMTGWLESYNGTKAGAIIKTMELDLKYRDDLPDSIDDVIVDSDGTWRASGQLVDPKRPPRKFYLVTNDQERFKSSLAEDNETLGVIVPGYRGCSWRMTEKPAKNGYYWALLEHQYICGAAEYEMYWLQAERKMESICRRFFGDGTVHKLVQTFLAFSYLQQHCEYDDQAFQCIQKEDYDSIARPWVTLPFGPLERNMGICCGIAYAMQMFLDHFGVPNLIIAGETGEGEDKKAHAWNLVRFADQYYHIDATYGVSGSQVFVGCFMKNDAQMRQTHRWDAGRFPEAKGKRFDYDFVENYIEDHEGELLDAGVEEMYLFPEEITE